MDAIDVAAAYRRYFPLIRAKCGRMLGDRAEAEDVAQETFTRLWSERDRLRNPDAIASWIYQTSTRLAIDRHQQVDRTELTDAERSDGGALGRLHSRDLLTRLARRMPRAELEALVLARVDGLSQPEIAEVIGVSERTVRRLLDKVDARLARLGEDARP